MKQTHKTTYNITPKELSQIISEHVGTTAKQKINVIYIIDTDRNQNGMFQGVQVELTDKVK